MPLTEPILTALIGLVGGIVGGVLSVQLQQWHGHRQASEDRSFTVYMMLLDLWAKHSTIVSADATGEVPPQEAKRDFSHYRYRISDEIRKADDLPEAEDILGAMFSLKFKTESDRARALDGVIEQLAARVNPRVTRAMKRISRDNQELMANHEEWRRRRSKIEWP